MTVENPPYQPPLEEQELDYSLTTLWSTKVTLFNPKKYVPVRKDHPVYEVSAAKTPGIDGNLFWLNIKISRVESEGTNFDFKLGVRFFFDRNYSNDPNIRPSCNEVRLLEPGGTLINKRRGFTSPEGGWGWDEIVKYENLPSDTDTIVIHAQIRGLYLIKFQLDEFSHDHRKINRTLVNSCTLGSPLLKLKFKDGEMTFGGKQVLIDHVPYFQAMFNTKCVESENNEISWPNVNIQSFEIYWQFLTSGSLPDEPLGFDCVCDAYEFARVLGFPALRARLIQHLLTESSLSKSQLLALICIVGASEEQVDQAIQKVLAGRLLVVDHSDVGSVSVNGDVPSAD